MAIHLGFCRFERLAADIAGTCEQIYFTLLVWCLQWRSSFDFCRSEWLAADIAGTCEQISFTLLVWCF